MTMQPAQRNARLGRGLASLIGDNPPVSVRSAMSSSLQSDMRSIPLDRIRPSALNPRKNFAEAELDELATSIREKGLVQPIVVRPVGTAGAEFEIVAGERRWRAAQRAGIHTIPAVVRALGDKEALELAIIENVQRADLNAIEEAAGYRELIERHGYTQEELGQIIGKSRSHLANTMRLLKLPDSVQALVRSGELSAGHARALVGRDDAVMVANDVVTRGLNVRDVEKLTRDVRGGRESRAGLVPKDADTRAAEREMSDALGLTVVLSPGTGEAGEIIIRYRTLEQLEAVKGRLT